MRQQMNRRGFTVVEVLIVLLIVVLLAAGGYMLMKRSESKNATTASDPQASSVGAVSTDVPTAPDIKNTKDLDTTAKTLDDTQLDNSDSAALDSQSDGF